MAALLACWHSLTSSRLYWGNQTPVTARYHWWCLIDMLKLMVSPSRLCSTLSGRSHYQYLAALYIRFSITNGTTCLEMDDVCFSTVCDDSRLLIQYSTRFGDRD